MTESIRVWVDGQEWQVPDTGDVLFGRSTEAQVRSANPLVSRSHAVLRHRGGGWIIQDVGSKRGTFLAGRRVEEVAVVAPTEIVLGDPQQGSVVRLLPSPTRPPADAVVADGGRPVTPPAAARAPGPADPPASGHQAVQRASDPLRTALATVIVLVAALLTDRLLATLDANDLLSKVGFSWLAAVPKVDEMLTRVRWPGRAAERPRPLAPSAPAPPRYTAYLYTTLVCAGVFAAAVYGGGVIVGLAFPSLFQGSTDHETMTAMAGVAVLVVGACTLFFVGRGIGVRDIARPLLVLLASTALGVTLITLFDFLAVSAEEYEAVVGSSRQSVYLFSVALWTVAAVTAGRSGIRRGTRRKERRRAAFS